MEFAKIVLLSKNEMYRLLKNFSTTVGGLTHFLFWSVLSVRCEFYK